MKILAAALACSLFANSGCAPSDAEAISLRSKVRGHTGLGGSGLVPFRDTLSFSAAANESYTCPDMPAILRPSAITQMSVSLWTKPAACGFATLGMAKTGEMTLFGRADCRVRMVITTNSSNYCETVINMEVAGTWIHILGVYNGAGAADADKCKIFINGVNQTQNFSGVTAQTSIAESANTLAIGGQQAAVYGDVAYWYSDQSANVAEIYNGGKGYNLKKFGPAAFYTYDDRRDAAGSGGLLYDQSGNGYTCTETNTESGDIVSDVP